MRTNANPTGFFPHFKPLPCFAAILFGLSTFASVHATDVCGPIVNDTTWTFAESPYHVTCNVVLFNTATLTIEPGVEIRFAPGTSLILQDATVTAIGTSALPIMFVSDNPDDSGDGLRLRGGFNPSGNFENCEFQSLQNAVHTVYNGAYDCELRIVGCRFLNNECALDIDYVTSSYEICDSYFADNEFAIEGLSNSVNTINGCVFERNVEAITWCYNVSFQNCRFLDNGIGLNSEHLGEHGISDSEFRDNDIAIELSGAGLIENCTISGNGVGVSGSVYDVMAIISQCLISENTIGVDSFNELIGNIITGNDIGIVFTGYNYGAIKCNNICGNTGYNVVMETDVSLMVDENWWGSIDQDEIAATIYDGFSDPSLGYLVYWPYLSLPAEQAYTCNCFLPWTRVADSGPEARCLHTMVYDHARAVTVLFGGFDDYESRNDTWQWNGMTWTQVADNGPSARYYHAMTYDSIRNIAVLFGGSGDYVNYYGDTWEWNGISWTEVSDTGPEARADHAMAYDSTRGVTVLFGGRGDYGIYLGDTWEWDGTTWTQVSDTGPEARTGHTMAYDSARGVTVLFGGRGDYGVYLGDTWEWDGTTWTQAADTGPEPRNFSAMAFDSARGITVLFGGNGDYSGYLGDTWEWDGATWTLVADSASDSPQARDYHAMVYDTIRNSAVLFGGESYASLLGDTWERQVWPEPIIIENPADLTLEVGLFASFSVVAESISDLTYQWRHDSVPLSDDDRINGATTPTLTIEGVETADAGVYDVIVSLECGGIVSEPATLTVGGAIPGDVDGDGDVDLNDLAALLGAYGSCTGQPSFNPAADFDDSGCIDLGDLATLLGNYGTGT